ncbi:hypothetical protein EPH_0018560 [Eimeria praecox]|uniref:Uncharacterized protein n=1 Tax=Eimeria praecox TaxID=51316 RepID=U6H124_9EIME|nr:hypothetical protein EPH_0018560 [Eimeria praecox]
MGKDARLELRLPTNVIKYEAPGLQVATRVCIRNSSSKQIVWADAWTIAHQSSWDSFMQCWRNVWLYWESRVAEHASEVNLVVSAHDVYREAVSISSLWGGEVGLHVQMYDETETLGWICGMCYGSKDGNKQKLQLQLSRRYRNKVGAALRRLVDNEKATRALCGRYGLLSCFERRYGERRLWSDYALLHPATSKQIAWADAWTIAHKSSWGSFMQCWRNVWLYWEARVAEHASEVNLVVSAHDVYREAVSISSPWGGQVGLNVQMYDEAETLGWICGMRYGSKDGNKQKLQLQFSRGYRNKVGAVLRRLVDNEKATRALCGRYGSLCVDIPLDGPSSRRQNSLLRFEQYLDSREAQGSTPAHATMSTERVGSA